MKAIYIRQSNIRFTKGKVYELIHTTTKRYKNAVSVIDNLGTLLTFWDIPKYWKPIEEHRQDIITEILK